MDVNEAEFDAWFTAEHGFGWSAEEYQRTMERLNRVQRMLRNLQAKLEGIREYHIKKRAALKAWHAAVSAAAGPKVDHPTNGPGHRPPETT